MSDGANRRKILQALGVDVWLTRGAPALEEAAPAAQRLPQTGRNPAAAVAAELRAPAVEPELPGRPVVSADKQPAPAAPVRPFTVICLSKGDVLMLIEPADLRAGHRFAADVLSALSGIWGGSMTKLAFEWPQPGIANDAQSVRRALGAFVSKQVGDNGDGLTLIGGELVERLPGVPEGCVILPPIDALMTRGELKRALWEELAGRQQR